MSEKPRPSPRRQVTQLDIANELGISRIAVSYALRRSRNVSKRTHEKVIETAAQMGYRVNAGARAMRLGSFSSLGLIRSSGWATSVIPNGLLSALMREVNSRHQHLVLAQIEDEQFEDLTRLPITIREHIVDGVFVYYTHGAPKLISKVLKKLQLPAIWLNSKSPRGCVYYDEVAAGRQVAARLVELGCKKFFWVDAPPPPVSEYVHYSREDRWTGFAEFLTEKGFKANQMLVPHDQVLLKFREAFRKITGPVGVLCYGARDLDSVGIAGLEKNWKLGEDFHLATISGEYHYFGDYEVESAYLDYDGLALAAMKALEAHLTKPETPPRSVYVPPLPPGSRPGANSPQEFDLQSFT